MSTFRTFLASFVIFCSVVHSVMAYEVYYGSWYLYFWIPFMIIWVCCCCRRYCSRKNEREQRTVYVEEVPTTRQQTTQVVRTTHVAVVGVVVPRQSQQPPSYDELQRGAIINSAYTPDSRTAGQTRIINLQNNDI